MRQPRALCATHMHTHARTKHCQVEVNHARTDRVAVAIPTCQHNTHTHAHTHTNESTCTTPAHHTTPHHTTPHHSTPQVRRRTCRHMHFSPRHLCAQCRQVKGADCFPTTPIHIPEKLAPPPKRRLQHGVCLAHVPLACSQVATAASRVSPAPQRLGRESKGLRRTNQQHTKRRSESHPTVTTASTSNDDPGVNIECTTRQHLL